MPVIGVDTPSLLLANGKFQEKKPDKKQEQEVEYSF